MTPELPSTAVEANLTQGKWLIRVAIATLLVAAWSIGEIAGIPRWVGVPLALLLAAYLRWGFRGFRWIVGVVLILIGAVGAIDIATSGPSSNAWGRIGQFVIVFAAIVTAPALVRSRAVGSYLDCQRNRRPEIAGSILIAIWIVILAVVAVLVWTGVGIQVF